MKIHETLSLLWGIQPIPPTLPLVERDGEMTLAEDEDEPGPLDWLDDSKIKFEPKSDRPS